MRAILLLIILGLLMFGCNPFAVEPHAAYIIEAGQHEGKHPVVSFAKRDLTFRVNWNTSQIYDLGNENQADINKLYGITSDKIHQNSARIGWRAVGDEIEVFAYWYKNGERGWESLGFTHPGTLDEFRVSVKDNKYVFTFTKMLPDKGYSKTVVVEGVDKKFFLNSYIAFPYFGGDEVAPHRMIFTIATL